MTYAALHYIEVLCIFDSNQKHLAIESYLLVLAFMMTDLSKDLVAASATPLVLSILKAGDSYGYAIIQRVRELSDGELQWADGMLYPILHRLENQNLIQSYWGKAENGRKRKYYRLRTAGTSELARLRDNWQLVFAMLKKAERVEPCST